MLGAANVSSARGRDVRIPDVARPQRRVRPLQPVTEKSSGVLAWRPQRPGSPRYSSPMLPAILGAILGVLATVVLSLLSAVPADIDRRDRQIGERDQELEAWMVAHHRGLKQRFQELEQQANANGVGRGGTIPAGQVAVKTLLLYDYREELRRATASSWTWKSPNAGPTASTGPCAANPSLGCAPPPSLSRSSTTGCKGLPATS